MVRLQEFVRQPSVSATGEGMAEAVEQVADYLRQLGCAEVEIVPTDGHPSVFAYYDAGAPKTIVNYGMYDVNAVDPTEWERPPFSGDLVATAEFHRFSTDEELSSRKVPIGRGSTRCSRSSVLREHCRSISTSSSTAKRRSEAHTFTR